MTTHLCVCMPLRSEAVMHNENTESQDLEKFLIVYLGSNTLHQNLWLTSPDIKLGSVSQVDDITLIDKIDRD